jgi:hypothetical protein
MSANGGRAASASFVVFDNLFSPEAGLKASVKETI